MSVRWSRALAGAALVALAQGLVACGPPEAPDRLYFEDFETACEEGTTPCGWERSGGEPSQVRWVETIHPGEHGLRLEEEIAVRGPAYVEGEFGAFSELLNVSVSAVCEPGASLAVNVVLTDSLGGSFSGRAILNPQTTWTAPTSRCLMLDGTPQGGQITGVVIRKNGTGACLIDELMIEVDTTRFGGC